MHACDGVFFDATVAPMGVAEAIPATSSIKMQQSMLPQSMSSGSVISATAGTSLPAWQLDSGAT